MTLPERPFEWWAKRAEAGDDGDITAGALGGGSKPGRARCAVPFCRRTASEEDGFVDQGFLCAAHWRLRTPATKAAWREHARIARRHPGPWWDHPPGSHARLIRLAIKRGEEALWSRTRCEAIESAMGVTA